MHVSFLSPSHRPAIRRSSNMYLWKKLHLAPPATPEEAAARERTQFAVENRSNCYVDLGELVDVGSAALTASALPAPSAVDGGTVVLVAVNPDEKEPKILRPAGGQWVECRPSDEQAMRCILDVLVFDGRLYAVTTCPRILEVELASDGTAEVAVLDGDYYEEGTAPEKTVNHIFDVHSDTDVHLLKVTSGRSGIKRVVVYW